MRKSLTALAAVLGVPCMILASADVIAAPQAAAPAARVRLKPKHDGVFRHFLDIA